MTVICDTPDPVSAHALIIGIGEYPYLNGGTEPTFSHHGGMRQLTSAPESARKLASWFLGEFRHPDYTSKTLDFLVSDADGQDYADPAGTVHAVERATMANIKDAIGRWVSRGSANPDSLLLFFFCGHGLGKGRQTILLAEDFGRLPGTQSLSLCIDFDQFYLGMDQCAALRQCYFVDACRVGTPFALNTLSYFGDPVMIPAAKASNPPRSAPVYYSAVPGTAAYGRQQQPSFFTDALLNAFKGAAADDPSGVWRVETDLLHRGIHRYLRRAVANTSAQGQLSQTDGMTAPFTLHQLASDPIVPVEVTCAPATHNPSAQLKLACNGNPQPNPATTGPWDIDLPVGAYTFEVAVPQVPAPSPINRYIRPPYQRLEFLFP